MTGIRHRLVALVVCGALSLLAGGAWAGDFFNGSFEMPEITGSNITLYTGGPGATSIPGWTVTVGSIDLCRSYWQPSQGAQSLDLNGISQGAISQTFNTTVNDQYHIWFDYAGNPNDSYKIKSLKVTAAAQYANFSFDTTGKSNYNMGWQTGSFSFTALTPTTTLTFASLIGGYVPYYGPALDNVRLMPYALANTTSTTSNQNWLIPSGFTLQLTGAITNDGAMTVQSSGAFNLNGLVTLNGSGQVVLNGGAVNGDAAAALTNNSTIQGGGIVNVPLTNNGTLNVTQDLTIDTRGGPGGSALAQNGALNVGPDAILLNTGGTTQTGGVVNIQGTVIDPQWKNHNTSFMINKGIYGLSGDGPVEQKNLELVKSFLSTLPNMTATDLQQYVNSNADLYRSSNLTPAVILNILQQNGGSTTIGGGLATNSATIQGGSLTINKGGTMISTSGTTSNGAAINVSGTLIGSLDLQGGTLGGNGTVDGSLLSSAWVSPGASPGILTVSGDYTQTAAGVLHMQLAGLAPDMFDQIKIGGAAYLGGLLEIELLDDFRPKAGDSFQIMTFGAVSGDFDGINGYDLGGGLYLREVFTDTNLNLVATSNVALPPSCLLLGSGMVALACWRRFRKS
jgi:choice-of-anchor C domain-containing protein